LKTPGNYRRYRESHFNNETMKIECAREIVALMKQAGMIRTKRTEKRIIQQDNVNRTAIQISAGFHAHGNWCINETT